VLCALGIELASFVLGSIRHGAVFGPGAANERQRALCEPAAAGAAAAPKPPVGLATLHPYLGYTFDPAFNEPQTAANVGLPISSWGFFDEGPPLRPGDPREFVVAVVGGSVAGMMAAQVGRVFEDALREDPRLAGRRVRLVRLALGGYKQPQQLLAISWLLAEGAHFDLVVNLDGFNEVALPPTNQLPAGVRASYPYDWKRLAAAAPHPLLLRALGRVEELRQARRERAREVLDSPLRWSPTVNLLWFLADERLAAQLAAAEAAVSAAPQTGGLAVAGPPAERPADRAALVALWERSSLQLHRLCAANGIVYLHALQPNQYDEGRKVLSAEELATAFLADSPYRPEVLAGYPELRAAGARLRAAGVRFVDLSDLFAGRAETLYIDSCCHLNQDGSARLARALVAAVLADPGLFAPAVALPARVEALAAAPAALEFDAPFARQALRIDGRTADGGTFDLTFAGTEYRSADPDVARVDRHGEVLARGRGRTVVTAASRGLTVEIPVRVGFPAVHNLGGATGGRAATRLRAEGAVERELRFRVEGPDAGPGSERQGALLVGTLAQADPTPVCGGTLWLPPAAVISLPFALAGGRARIAVPLPAGIDTAVVQALFAEPPPSCAFALSNALAVTPD
jgi:hypothetical protein